MIPGTFEYYRPTTVDEAVRLLAEHGDEARVLAGGHSLIPMMKLRMATPENLIDLQDVEELKGIGVSGGQISIGAMTTQAETIASEALAASCPLLAETASQISDPQIRNLGTIGGNVANGDPGNDMPAVMQTLDATFHLAGSTGTRQVAARDFYETAFFTALEDGEVLTAISFNVPPAGHGWAYEKQKRKVGDYATAAAAVVLTISDGRCQSAAIGLTNVGDTPLYAAEASRALEGSDLGEEAIRAAVAAARAITNPAKDARGPVEFRSHVAGIMVARAIERAAKRAA